jgi:hypothetical protein
VSRPKTARSIAGQIEKTFQANMRLLQESMAGLPKNCKAYLDRVLAVARLQQNYRDERAARGLDPVNLGNSARTVYSFNATIDTQSALDAERQAFEEKWDAEYPDSTQAPHHQHQQHQAKKSKKRGKQ